MRQRMRLREHLQSSSNGARWACCIVRIHAAMLIGLASMLPGGEAHARDEEVPDDPPPPPVPPPKPKRGPQLGVRAGDVLPGGTITGYVNLGDRIGNLDAFSVEGGYRYGWLYVGGVFLAGPAMPSGGDRLCLQQGTNCNVQDYQVGLGARAYVAPTSVVTPWFGLGFSWEILATQISASGASASGTFTGPLMVHQFGVDFSIGPVSLGPFLGASLGPYVTHSLDRWRDLRLLARSVIVPSAGLSM